MVIILSTGQVFNSLAKHDCSFPQPSGGLLCRQSFSNFSRSGGKYIRRIQENDARRNIWEIPVPMGLPRSVSSAVFRTFTSHDFLQPHPHQIRVKCTPDCLLCLGGKAMNCFYLAL
ncbi:hypothetical protein TNCV_4066751 [Trichonephila clavipes]|uniref:Uncharacterized protein n=1 Tax=Trichonephila clavipes TaxID=2585209 RepID=A0A8X6W8V4_TRICX|nr:hypothetical protein TNCV_4066751 [Trichonephila clavipes]